MQRDPWRGSGAGLSGLGGAAAVCSFAGPALPAGYQERSSHPQSRRAEPSLDVAKGSLGSAEPVFQQSAVRPTARLLSDHVCLPGEFQSLRIQFSQALDWILGTKSPLELEIDT